MSVRIHGREHNPRDVEYFFTSEWEDGGIHEGPGDFFPVYIDSSAGGARVGIAYSEDGARKILGFVKR